LEQPDQSIDLLNLDPYMSALMLYCDDPFPLTDNLSGQGLDVRPEAACIAISNGGEELNGTELSGPALITVDYTKILSIEIVPDL